MQSYRGIPIISLVVISLCSGHVFLETFHVACSEPFPSGVGLLWGLKMSVFMVLMGVRTFLQLIDSDRTHLVLVHLHSYYRLYFCVLVPIREWRPVDHRDVGQAVRSRAVIKDILSMTIATRHDTSITCHLGCCMFPQYSYHFCLKDAVPIWQSKGVLAFPRKHY